MGKKVRLTSRRAAVPTPENSNLSFTSAASLLQSITPTACDKKDISESKSTEQVLDVRPASKRWKHLEKKKDIGKSTKGKGIRGSGLGSMPKIPCGSTVAKASFGMTGEDSATKKKYIKKSRDDDQSTIRKAKITKPGKSTSAAIRSKQTVEKNCCVRQEPICENEEIKAKIEGPNQLTLLQGKHDLGLEEALKRKRDWTPVKSPEKGAVRPNDVEAALSCDSPANETSSAVGFGKLIESFGYAAAGKTSPERKHTACTVEDQTFTKRRKLNLISGVALTTSMSISIKRNKSSKKKPQTITDKATAPFIAEVQGAASIQGYFVNQVSGAESKNANNTEGKALSTKVTKASTKKSKTLKNMKRTLALLSPDSAKMTVNEQDLLFGTSSQLVREESPTFIRDLQETIKQSEIVDDSYSMSCEEKSQISIQSVTSNASNSKLPAASRNLWAVAARDNTGSLLNVDVVDLVDTPRPLRSLPAAADIPNAPEDTQNPLELVKTVVDEGWTAVDDVVNDSRCVESAIPRSVAEASLRERPRSRSPIKKPKKGKDSESFATETPRSEMPNYSGFTDMNLKKAAAEFGFKPIKRREEVIPLLESCWRSKNRIALQALPPNVSGAAASTSNGPTKRRGRPPKSISIKSGDNGAKAVSATTPKKPGGRPKKSTSNKAPKSGDQADKPIEEILDTGCPPHAPSPPRRTSAKPPNPLVSTSSLATTVTTTDQQNLLPSITKAITNYPPTHNPKNLTWYEKMLLYDPIVLEDLTDWLNEEGLSRVGCNEVMTPVMVKQWCESQSVCCLWKENLKGGKRARY
ncbi:MAG: hypothetical protein Q9170_002154 [Blastenia crenularia]